MKRIITVLVYLILIFLVLILTEANSKIMGATNQIDITLFGPLFEKYFPIIKAISYSLSTIVIIVYYRSLIIRISFIVFDASIIFIYHYVDYERWFKYSSFYYALLTALIFIFIGNIAHKYYINSDQFKLKRNTNELNLNKDMQIRDLKQKMNNLKRTGRSKLKWFEIPEKKNLMDLYQVELDQLQK